MPDENQDSDAELIRRSAAGERSAFNEIVERHEASVYRFARAIASSEQAAEDALQEAFLGAWRGAAAFRGEASVRNWLFSIVRHAVYRQHRHRVDEPEEVESLSSLGVAAGWSSEETPETIALRRESHEAIVNAMEALNVSDREILLLRDVEDLPGEEVATLLGLAVPAMKSRLHRARLRLAAKVREAYAQA